MSSLLDKGISSCQPGNLTCNYDTNSPNFFSSDIQYSSYGYNVKKSSAYGFLILFALSAVIHLIQGGISRHRWTLYTFGLGAIGESIGWGGRMMSYLSTKWLPDAGGFWWSKGDGFLIQISTLIISPAFLSAGDYILLGRVMNVLGRGYSPVHPVSYSILCITGDVVSLVIQAIGGGMASAADDEAGQNSGANVMVVGIFIQIVVMTFYSIILLTYIYRWSVHRPFARQLEFFKWWPNALRTKRFKRNAAGNGAGRRESERTVVEEQGRYWTQREIRNAKVLLGVCVFTTLLIFIRSIYRACELIDGWRGAIITNQSLFDGLDGALMLLVCLVFNIFHPLFWLPKNTSPAIEERGVDMSEGVGLGKGNDKARGAVPA